MNSDHQCYFWHAKLLGATYVSIMSGQRQRCHIRQRHRCHVRQRQRYHFRQRQRYHARQRQRYHVRGRQGYHIRQRNHIGQRYHVRAKTKISCQGKARVSCQAKAKISWSGKAKVACQAKANYHVRQRHRHHISTKAWVSYRQRQRYHVRQRQSYVGQRQSYHVGQRQTSCQAPVVAVWRVRRWLRKLASSDQRDKPPRETSQCHHRLFSPPFSSHDMFDEHEGSVTIEADQAQLPRWSCTTRQERFSLVPFGRLHYEGHSQRRRIETSTHG